MTLTANLLQDIAGTTTWTWEVPTWQITRSSKPWQDPELAWNILCMNVLNVIKGHVSVLESMEFQMRRNSNHLIWQNSNLFFMWDKKLSNATIINANSLFNSLVDIISFVCYPGHRGSAWLAGYLWTYLKRMKNVEERWKARISNNTFIHWYIVCICHWIFVFSWKIFPRRLRLLECGKLLSGCA